MNIPKLFKGSVIPNPQFSSDTEKLIKEKEIKQQYTHDWKIAIFNTFVGAISGGIMGFITSIIFWLITK